MTQRDRKNPPKNLKTSSFSIWVYFGSMTPTPPALHIIFPSEIIQWLAHNTSLSSSKKKHTVLIGLCFFQSRSLMRIFFDILHLLSKIFSGLKQGEYLQLRILPSKVISKATYRTKIFPRQIRDNSKTLRELSIVCHL